MKPYADTNFFTRLYLPLPESEKADSLLETARKGHAVPVTWLHRMELVNAFELSVCLGRQGGHPVVSGQQAAAALATFQEDLVARTFLAPANPDLVKLESSFEETAQRHTSKQGFRTYDILHVVSARLLGCDTFFSFDQKARRLAVLEGLDVAD
jgi:predicted nucleic acid-binding protein